MAYQNINQYVYRKFYLRPIYTGQDMSLASDERDYNQEVIFSPYVIGVDDGQVLPINIDFGSTANTETFNLSYDEYDFDNIVISSNYWLPSNYNPYCLTSQTICDIGLTGTDNGLVTGMTGQTIEIFNYPLTGSNKFDRYSFGQQMKFHQITGFTNSPNQRFSGVSDGTIYSIVSKSASTIGYYQQIYGGFYQTFYKLFGYEYQALPTRMSKGWTAELLLKPRLVDEFLPPSGYTTANDFRPNNENIFFYLGTRAENKYWHHASGETTDSGYTRVTSGLTSLQTCACGNTGVTNANCEYVYPPTGVTQVHSACTCSCGCAYCTVNINEPEHNPLYDSMSNALGIKFSGDPGNPNICIRVLRMTGDCITTGTCVTGETSVTGYTIDEYCSTRGIYYNCSGTSFVEQEHWVQIDAVWERYSWFDECDLIYKGGLGTITSYPYSATVVGDTISLIEPPTTHPGSPEPKKLEIVELNNQWLLEKEFRLGELKIFVNGMLFFVVPDFEEIIPRGLNTMKERQVGVPFNMSVGGGTQGLHENLVFSGLPITLENNYIQDPELFPDDILSGTTLSGLTTNILLEKHFAGSFDGGLSQFRFYTKPLSVPEVQHNFRILKERFRLYDPFCPSCIPVPEDLEITINECDCPPNYVQLADGSCAPITEVPPNCNQTIWATWQNGNSAIFNFIDSSTISLNVTSTEPISLQSLFEGERLTCPDKNPSGNTISAIENIGTYTYTFSEPVTNPLLAVYSLGRDAPPPPITAILSADTPFTIYCSATTEQKYAITYDLINQSFSGTEGYGIVKFNGTVSQITLSYSPIERFTQLTWGIPCTPTCPEGCELVDDGGDLYCKCLGEPIPCEDVPENPFVFCMDYIVVTYEFDTGRDLDIKVGLFNTTQTEYLGWCASNNFPLGGSWPNDFSANTLTWGGDNTGRGFETILVNISNYRTLFPSNGELKLDLRCWWYGEAGITPVSIRADLYNGGTMRLVSLPSGTYTWQNDGYLTTKTVISPKKTISGPATSVCQPQGFRFATFTYNIDTCEAVFNIDDDVPPPMGPQPTPQPTPTPTPTQPSGIYTIFLHVPI